MARAVKFCSNHYSVRLLDPWRCRITYPAIRTFGIFWLTVTAAPETTSTAAAFFARQVYDLIIFAQNNPDYVNNNLPSVIIIYEFD